VAALIAKLRPPEEKAPADVAGEAV
jgi:hypothetical protein